MQTQQFSIKQDISWLIAGTAIIGIILKILFPLSGIAEIARLIGGVFWLFVLPGWCIMLPWRNEIELKERIVVGMLAAAGLFAMASYYFGILGVHIRIHTFLFPIIVPVVSAILFYSKRFMKRAQALH
ncbi:MAG: hypothetical protein QXT19_01785 [Candidatus Woesearchaeota archaeon]